MITILFQKIIFVWFCEFLYFSHSSSRIWKVFFCKFSYSVLKISGLAGEYIFLLPFWITNINHLSRSIGSVLYIWILCKPVDSVSWLRLLLHCSKRATYILLACSGKPNCDKICKYFFISYNLLYLYSHNFLPLNNNLLIT